MYTTVATNLYIKYTTTPADASPPHYSQPVEMGEDNAAMIDVTAFNLTISTDHEFVLELEGSNDLQNWESASASASDQIKLTDTSTPGYTAADESADSSYAYMRIKYSSSGTPTNNDYVLVNAGINTYHK